MRTKFELDNFNVNLQLKKIFQVIKALLIFSNAKFHQHLYSSSAL
jgi:hypothetical protein